MSELIVKIPASAAGERLSSYLAAAGYPVHADCGGRGKCGKCKVRVIEGSFLEAGSQKALEIPADGWILSCRAICTDAQAVVELPPNEGTGLTNFAAEKTGEDTACRAENVEYGVALDIGTTTLAAALVDRTNRRVIATRSCLNPQKSFGADVMSRISACSAGHLEELHRLIIDAANRLIAQLMEGTDVTTPVCLTAVGNTTMVHLFCNVSPCGMGAYPFTPAFTETKIFPGEELGLNAARVIVPASASAFIGSDVIAGVMMGKMMDSDDPCVIMDIGTNGEMILFTGKKHGGELIAVSTAAGPAMEGAGISCGVGGITGAICAVKYENSALNIKTIGDAAPVGVCGSGLIDLIAALLARGDIDETGFMEDEEAVVARTGDDGELTLTQADVRAFQLAKSALRAGLEALVADNDLETAQVSRLCLAGGLGYYMNIDSAVAVGLLPEELHERVETVGNTALGGAIQCQYDEESVRELSEIAAAIQTRELNQSQTFNDGFIEYMMFPEEE